jgi:hypothetical protein
MAFEHSSEDSGTWFKYPDQGAEKIKFLPMTFCRCACHFNVLAQLFLAQH